MRIHDETKITKLWSCEWCNSRFVKKHELIRHYGEFHDGNVPQELWKAGDNSGEDQEEGNPVTVQALKENDDDIWPQDNGDQSEKSLQTLNSALSKGNHIFDILLAGTRIACPRPKCDRTFSRDYDLQRHLKWHQQHLAKVLEYLEALEREELENTFNEVEINQLIDHELKSIDNVQ